MNTTRDYKFTLHVELPMSTDVIQTHFCVGGFSRNHEQLPFLPFDKCSDALTAHVVDSGVTEIEARKITRDREEIAKEISERMTRAILDGIESKDLENGYQKPNNQS